jgi:hypothetical protein
MDDLLNSLIDLQLASLQIPKDFDYKFSALDEEFQAKSQQVASATYDLSQVLVSFLLDQPTIANETEFFLESDRAISQLLAARELDMLHRPPAKSVDHSHIEHREIDGVTFIFSPHVPQPAKFIHSIELPSAIPVLESIPLMEFRDAVPLASSQIQLIASAEALAGQCATMQFEFPNGPIYVAFANHRVRTYRPFPCLCILMTPAYSVFVVDILKVRNAIDPLARLLIDPQITHVMYCPKPDIRILAECFGL